MRRIQNYVVNKSPSFFQKKWIRRGVRKKQLLAEKVARKLIKIVIKDAIYLALNCRFDENCDMVDSDSDDSDDDKSKDSDSIRYYYDI
jgi:hypothetical protein